MARRSGGGAFFFYAPMMLPDAETARVLRTQAEIARALEYVPRRDQGGGRRGGVAAGPVDGGRCALGAGVARDIRPRRAGELSGVQLDADGNPVMTPLTARLIAIDAEQLHDVPEVIAIAYGPPRQPPSRPRYEVASSRASSRTRRWRASCCSGVTAMSDDGTEVVLHGGITNAGLVSARGGQRSAPVAAHEPRGEAHCSITWPARGLTARRGSSASTTRAARCSRSFPAMRPSSPFRLGP